MGFQRERTTCEDIGMGRLVFDHDMTTNSKIRMTQTACGEAFGDEYEPFSFFFLLSFSFGLSVILWCWD